MEVMDLSKNTRRDQCFCQDWNDVTFNHALYRIPADLINAIWSNARTRKCQLLVQRPLNAMWRGTERFRPVRPPLPFLPLAKGTRGSIWLLGEWENSGASSEEGRIRIKPLLGKELWYRVNWERSSRTFQLVVVRSVILLLNPQLPQIWWINWT